ncbi:MAG: hypothetical protein ACE15C_16555 [Phycisphaerae bacterium]
MKWLRRIILLVLVLSVLVVAGVFIFIDSIAKAGIEKGGTYATGVPTEVQSVKLSLLGGTFSMDNMKIGNPQGFTSPHAIKTGRFELEVAPTSVLGSTVQVRKFVLDGMDINIDTAGVKNNISAILDHIKGLGGSGQPSAEASKAEKPAGDSGKKIKIDKIIISNIVAHVQAPGGVVNIPPIKVQKLELDNVSSDDNGATVSQIISRLIPAVLLAVTEQGKGLIPGDLLGSLNKDLASTVGNLGPGAQKMFSQLPSDTTKGLGDVTKPLGNIPKDILNLIPATLPAGPKDIRMPADGLLGGDKR